MVTFFSCDMGLNTWSKWYGAIHLINIIEIFEWFNGSHLKVSSKYGLKVSQILKFWWLINWLINFLTNFGNYKLSLNYLFSQV